MMQNIKPYLLFVILFLFQNKTQAQNTFNKKVSFPSSIGDLNSSCKLYNANDGGYWLMASETSYSNLKAGGHISHFTADGTIIESKQVMQSDTSSMLILDFVEMPNGNRAFVFQENLKNSFQGYVRTVLLQIFDPQWNQIASTVLDNKGITSDIGYNLGADSDNNLYLTYRSIDLKIWKFDSKANMIWARKIEGDNAYNNLTSIVKPQSKGLITLDDTNLGLIVYNFDENGNDIGSKKITNFQKSDMDFFSNGNLLLTGFTPVFNPTFGSKSNQNAWIELSSTFNVLSTRYFSSSSSYSGKTVITKNDGFVFFSFNDYDGATYFQFDSKRKLINSKYYYDKAETTFNVFDSNFIVLPNGDLVSTYKLDTKKSELRLRLTDANLDLLSCQGKQVCSKENSFSVTIEPYTFGCMTILVE